MRAQMAVGVERYELVTAVGRTLVTGAHQSRRVPRPLPFPDACGVAIVVVTVTVACADSRPRFDGGDERAIAQIVDVADCLGETLRPSSAPPPEGRWSLERDDRGRRVAVVIGPAEIGATSTRVTRAIDALEDSAGSRPMRVRFDSAAVQVEGLPPYRDGAPPEDFAASEHAISPQRAAVYALSPTVLVASYEGCTRRQPSAIRYLRRNAAGRIVTDAMLRRQSTTVETPR